LLEVALGAVAALTGAVLLPAVAPAGVDEDACDALTA
jgi:hypothetical protein